MLPYYMYDDMPKLSEHKTVAEISINALKYNYRLLTDVTGAPRRICVVKADAYGHVADICVRALVAEGCDFFAVSCIEEAISVRNICNDEGSSAEILILGYTDCRQARALCENNVIQTLLSVDYAKELSKNACEQGCCVRAHVALDTGMNRIGICACSDSECDSAARAIMAVRAFDGICIEGMFTHFAKSDEEDSLSALPRSHTLIQADRFIKVKNLLENEGVSLFCHVCNSAAAVRFPSLAFDAVRLGIMLYGIPPSKHVSVDLKPVMSLKTVISHIHRLLPGESVSYGGEFKSESERVIATLPIGYADGFLRAYSGCSVTVGTADGIFKAKVIGRICMDQCMIDVTDIPARVGDTVTLFGNDPHELDELARLADTIGYECVCLVSARVPRVKKDER